MLSWMLCCLSFFLGRDPRLVLAGETVRSMEVRFLGDLRPRGGPGLGASPPGIAAVSARPRKREKIAGTHLPSIWWRFCFRFVHGDRVGDLVNNHVTNLARQYGDRIEDFLGR
jgi:hypothetical protein